MIRIILVLALREVKRNTLRSFLTMLGIVIGVGSVIALVTIGGGASAKVPQDIGKLGTNLLIVSPGGTRRSSASRGAPSGCCVPTSRCGGRTSPASSAG